MSTRRKTPPRAAGSVHPGASRAARPRPAAPAGPTPGAQRTKSRRFDDDPNRRPDSGTSFLKLQAVRRGIPGCAIRAYVATPCFAGKSMALFDENDLAMFIQLARDFAARRTSVAAIQGGAPDEGGLRQVLVGIHIYRPGSNPGRAAARIVVASPTSDDLLTVTLQSAPLLIAQFADQMAALTDGARDTALLIGQ